MSENNAVIVERRDRVMIITLNRPEAMNAINGDLSHGLWNAVQELNDDPGLTAGVLTGAGKGFSSGMDLKAFAAGEDIGPMQEFIQAGAEKPPVTQRDEQDRGDDRRHGREDAQEQTARLKVQKAFLRLNVPRVNTDPQLFSLSAGDQVPQGTDDLLRFAHEVPGDLSRLLAGALRELCPVFLHQLADER